MKNIVATAYKLGYRVLQSGELISKTGECLKCQEDKRGYLRVIFKHKGQSFVLLVHQLQAYQKYGDAYFADGILARHLNGNSKDNSWDNIGIGTHSDNMMDIPKHVRVSKAVYASSFVKKHCHDEVIAFYRQTKSYRKTMDKFGISSKGTLHYILNNRRPIMKK